MSMAERLASAPRSIDDPELIGLLEEHQVEFTRQPSNNWFTQLLSWILPALIFVGIWLFIIRRMSGGGGLMSIGKSKAKVYMEKGTGITFDDVAGIDEAKEELQEIVEFLRTPERFQALGGRIPRGVLLVGSPGTGKTLLAKAVAGEASVPFFSLSGSDFVEMFVGVGAARVRDLFEQAKKHAPAIIFIDELDALGKARGAGSFGGHDEREQTLNQLLTELDGFDTNAGVILMAATNRPEILDPALLRPGRFDRTVAVDRPDVKGRAAILQIHAKEVKLGPDVDLHKLAVRTPGFAGADLANVVNEAALLAARRDKDSITMSELEEAIERSVAGLERKSRVLNEKERRIVAYHEARPRHRRRDFARGQSRAEDLHRIAGHRRLGLHAEYAAGGPLFNDQGGVARFPGGDLGAVGRPRKSSLAKYPPARPTTCSRLRKWPSGWSKSSA